MLVAVCEWYSMGYGGSPGSLVASMPICYVCEWYSMGWVVALVV